MTETVVIERALIVMAVCLVIQTAGMCAGAISMFVAWRQAKRAIDEQMTEVRSRISDVQARVDRVSDTVEDAAHAFKRSVTAVHDAVDHTQHAVQAAATLVASPKAALALGALRGLQWWRRSRSERRAGARPSPPKLVVQNRT
ncbi:MAG: hypothetical protein ABI665_02930 [Vicinamibacterales bacterium]